MNLIFLNVLLLMMGCGQENIQEKQIKAAMRTIGHEILQFSGDTTTRILPIENEGNRYQIQFESDFRLNPSTVVIKVDEVFKKTKLTEEYFVEVKACETGEVVHSYGVEGILNPPEVACGTRKYAKTCYTIFITLLDAKEENSGVPIFVFFLLLIVLVTAVIIWKKKRVIANDPNIIRIGQYHFDQRNMILFIEKIEVELTSKEADLLSLLYTSANTTLERDHILNVVWGDEGDYVGRTLDVFISKLRKKLEADPNIKIVNVRGVGYKMVLNHSE